MLKGVLKSAFQAIGLDVRRYRPIGRRRASLIGAHGIEIILDVGANVGQYATELRAFGFTGSILSFEPSRDAYAVLERRSAGDPAWECMRLALGERNEELDLRLSSNSASSSLLDMLDVHRRAAPEVSVVGTETTSVRTLDSLDLPLDRPAMLKLDVQGFEDRVLRGADRSLRAIKLIECELSVVPLYRGQLPMREMLDLLLSEGYELTALEPGLRAPDGGMLQVDGFFLRV